MKENQIAKTYKVSTWLKRRQRVLAYFTNFMGKSKKDIGLRECQFEDGYENLSIVMSKEDKSNREIEKQGRMYN